MQYTLLLSTLLHIIQLFTIAYYSNYLFNNNNKYLNHKVDVSTTKILLFFERCMYSYPIPLNKN